MFGSNIRKQSQPADTPVVGDQNNAAPVHADQNPVVVPPPPQVTPTAPPLNDAAEVMPHQSDPIDDSSPAVDLPNLNNVNLGNSYIVDNPQANAKADDAPADQPTAASLVTKVNEDELLGIKHQALQHLAPLIDELEQSPEEKFRTTMMMIQASDNPDLIKEAFDAANSIKDEKARAQALLDVVNEINYFTQHDSNGLEQAKA